MKAPVVDLPTTDPQTSAARQPTLAVMAVWVVTRMIALASIALTPRLLDDIDIFRGWLPYLRGAAFPTDDPKWQYPPAAGPLLLAPDAVHLDYAVAFALACLAADAAILAALLLAHRRRPGSSLRGPWLWAAAALVVGPIMFTRFDIVPTMAAVAFVLLAGRPALAGVSAAAGFVVKLWPALLLLALPRPATRRGLAAFTVTTVALMAVISLRFDGALSFIGNQSARGLQIESVGALPYELYSLGGGHVAYGLQYGSVQVLMTGAEAVATAIAGAGLLLILLIGWWRLTGRLESVPPGDVALAVVLVSVATSRVYSPQFNVWIIGVCAVALLSPRTRMAPVAALLVLVSLLTQWIYPWDPYGLTDADPKGVIVQGLRIVGLILATLWALRAIGRRPARRVATMRIAKGHQAPVERTLVGACAYDAARAGLGHDEDRVDHEDSECRCRHCSGNGGDGGPGRRIARLRGADASTRSQ